jgi:hypothetical protein
MHKLLFEGNPAHQGKEDGDPRAGIVNLHSHHEEIPARTKTSITRQYDEIIPRPTILSCREYILGYGNKTDSQPNYPFG